jgi:hypothetical protein
LASALRQIFASFGVEFDAEALEKGNKKIDESKKKLRELGEFVLEAFAVEKLGEFTLGMAEQAEQIEHTAQATGLATEELQAWQFGAKKAGLENEEFTAALRRLSLALAGGKNELGTQSALLTKLGATTQGAHGQAVSLADVLPKIADEFAKMPDGPKKAAEATALFGRQGARLIPLLNKGAEGVLALKEELNELGGGFSPEFIEESSKLIEQTRRLEQGWTSLKVKLAGYLLPAVDAVVGGLIKFVSWGGKLAQETNIVTAALVALGIKGAASLISLAVANAPLLLEFGLMAAGIGLVALAIDELITTWQGGDSLISRAIDKIFGAGSTARAVAWIKSIGNGIAEMFSEAANDTEAYHETWQKALAGIESDTDGFGGYWSGFLAAATDTFFATVNGLSNGWEGFGNFMSGIIDGLGFSFEVVWDNIKYAGLGVAAALSDAFQNFLASLGPVTDLAKKLGVDVSAGHAGADLAADKASHDKARLAEAEDIDARIRGTGKYAPKAKPGSAAPEGGGDTTVNVNHVTNVTVPGGTPGHVAKQVGRASSQGAANTHRAAANALAQGAPKK